MEIVRNKAALDDWRSDEKLAYVPTMGALHDGHLSLVRLAKSKGECVAVSIFVNPTQFAPHEDFDRYPRQLDHDAALLKAEGVDLLYAPTAQQMYPKGVDEPSPYQAGEAAQGLETDFRPHFFGGVVNVVGRLFDHVKPDIAIFGEKDYQQLQVIREMVEQYDLGIEIVGAPIARDEYGLALSSRNAYLSPDALEIARKLNVILRDVPVSDAPQALLESGFDKVDYVAQRWGRVLGAAWLGEVRLIDNLAVR